MWRPAFVFLIVMPAAALAAGLVVLRAWRRYPLGRVARLEAERREKERIERAVSSLGGDSKGAIGEGNEPNEER